MTIPVTNTVAPLGAVTVFRIVNGILNFKNTVAAWNETRVTRKLLLSLSDEQLNDIGLTRSDLG